jgi:hypothetical protein
MRSGRPRSSISTISPPASSATHNSPDSRARDLYAACPNTLPTDATFSAPEAATIRKIANTCGVPHTISLFMPVTTWPSCSITSAAPSPTASTTDPASSSHQKRRSTVEADRGITLAIYSPA